ncbi:MAG: Ig-like domain-containing protein, partial [Acidobacteriota bacterium]
MRTVHAPSRSLGYLLLMLCLGLSASVAGAQPRRAAISPSPGVTSDDAVTLTAIAADAVRAVVDGREAPLVDGRFEAGPFELSEGPNRFLIVLEDAEGLETAWVHTVVADRQAPILTLGRAPGFTKERKIQVTGAAVDPHLESVRVGGDEAAVTSGRFAAEVALRPGPQRIEVVARDALGHESRVSLDVTLDVEPPSVAIRAGGATLDGRGFRAAVVPEVAVDGAERLELRLNGRPFTRGEAVAAEGEHRLEVVAIDASGLRSTSTATFTVDRTPPNFGRFKDAGRTVGEASYVVEGRVEGASSVTVDGLAAELEGGVFRAGPFDLPAGERRFQIVARDTVGNERSASLQVKSDPEAPVVTIGTPASGAVLSSSPVTLTGAAVDVDLNSVLVANPAAGVNLSATLSGDDFSAEVALVEGANAVTVTATDAVGHSASAERTVTLDSTPPVLALLVDGAPLVDGAIFSGFVTPEAQATDATAVTVAATLDGLAYVPGTTITAFGSHELSVTATDGAGHSTTLIRTFTLEGAAPVIADLRPADGDVVAAAAVQISGRAPGAASVEIHGVEVIPAAGGDFISPPVSLHEGVNAFTVFATSAGGQTGQLILTVIRDSTAPALTLSAPADGAVTADAVVTVRGSVVDPYLEALAVNGAAATVTGDPASGATFEASVTLAEGNNRLRVEATDRASNRSGAEVEIALDTRAPALSILDPAPGTVVGGGAVTLTGRVADPHLDQVEVDGVVAPISGSGGGERTWTVEVPVAAGPSTVTATAVDTLGHTSTASLELTGDGGPNLRITSPIEGTATSAAAITVSGDVAAGSTVTVNGLPATVTADGFTVADVPLNDGDNRLIARAALGDEESTHVRGVTRDNAPPQVVAVSPADGAEEQPRSTAVAVAFSEALAPPAAGAWRLETAAGVAVPAEGTFAAGELDATRFTVRPLGPLPPSTEIRLVLTSQLVDRAGNALSAAGPWSFTTVQGGAPAAPVLDALPDALCANTVSVSGAAPSGSRVVVEGGGALAEVRAGVDGAFAVDVSLEPGRFHVLGAYAVGAEGRESASATAAVAQDCEPPEVLAAARSGDVITVHFDAPVDASTVAVSASNAAGALAGALDVTGDTATWTAAQSLGSGVVRLEVGPGTADLAGN